MLRRYHLRSAPIAEGISAGEFAAFGCGEFANFVAGEFASLRIAEKLRPNAAEVQNHRHSRTQLIRRMPFPVKETFENSLAFELFRMRFEIGNPAA